MSEPASNGTYATARLVAWQDRAVVAFGIDAEGAATAVLRWKGRYDEWIDARAAARRGEARAGEPLRAWRTRSLLRENGYTDWLSRRARYRWAPSWRAAADLAARDPDGKRAVTEECDPLELLRTLDGDELAFHCNSLFGGSTGRNAAFRRERAPPADLKYEVEPARELERFRREAALHIRLAMLIPDYTVHRIRRGRRRATGDVAQTARRTLVKRHAETIGTRLVNRAVDEGLRPLVRIFTPVQEEILREVAARYGFEPAEELSQLQLAVIWSRGARAAESWIMKRDVLAG